VQKNKNLIQRIYQIMRAALLSAKNVFCTAISELNKTRVINMQNALYFSSTFIVKIDKNRVIFESISENPSVDFPKHQFIEFITSNFVESNKKITSVNSRWKENNIEIS
jgi:hypothetical protein